tara:strand:+ start:29 stop:307 length:279 start_codon:yes stop_codon:yes gene_type:complete
MAIKNKKQMMEYIGQHMDFVSSAEEFSCPDSIWVSGEGGDTYGGLPIYDYNARYDNGAYELGVNLKWAKQLENYGWWSEWYDSGTVMIHKDD